MPRWLWGYVFGALCAPACMGVCMRIKWTVLTTQVHAFHRLRQARQNHHGTPGRIRADPSARRMARAGSRGACELHDRLYQHRRREAGMDGMGKVQHQGDRCVSLTRFFRGIGSSGLEPQADSQESPTSEKRPCVGHERQVSRCVTPSSGTMRERTALSGTSRRSSRRRDWRLTRRTLRLRAFRTR